MSFLTIRGPQTRVFGQFGVFANDRSRQTHAPAITRLLTDPLRPAITPWPVCGAYAVPGIAGTPLRWTCCNTALIVQSSLYGLRTNAWKPRKLIFTPTFNLMSRPLPEPNPSQGNPLAIAPRTVSWLFSMASDNAEHEIANRGDPFGFTRDHLQLGIIQNSAKCP